MVYVVVLGTLLVCANTVRADYMTVTVRNSSSGVVCSTIRNMLHEGETTYIDFYYTHHDVVCRSLSTNNKIKISVVSEGLNWKRYKVDKVKPSMHGIWKCNLLPNGDACDVSVRVRSKDLSIVKMNKVVIGSKWSNTELYDSVAEYTFYKDELVLVECGKEKAGIITIHVQDEPNVLVMQDKVKSVEMLMRMNSKYDGKYIDCYHDQSGMASVVRINLKLNQEKYNEREMQVDNPTLPTSEREVDTSRVLPCRDIQGEKFYVSCKNIIIKGLKGLQSSNILFLYKNSTGGVEIHYEYTEGLTFNLSWDVTLMPNELNEYEVYWNGATFSSFKVMTTQASTDVTLDYPPITPNSGDELIVSKIVSKLKPNIRIRIMVRRVDELSVGTTLDPKLKFYILAGVLCFIIISLAASIYFLNKKFKKPVTSATDENFYSYVYDQFPRFARRWEAFQSTETTSASYPDEVLYCEIKSEGGS